MSNTSNSNFWRKYSLILLHVPAWLLGATLVYLFLVSQDKNIGLEGFGDVFGYFLNGVRAALIVFTAWWMKRAWFFDINREAELRLRGRELDGDRMARWAIVRDRIEWVVLLCLTTYWFTR